MNNLNNYHKKYLKYKKKYLNKKKYLKLLIIQQGGMTGSVYIYLKLLNFYQAIKTSCLKYVRHGRDTVLPECFDKYELDKLREREEFYKLIKKTYDEAPIPTLDIFLELIKLPSPDPFQLGDYTEIYSLIKKLDEQLNLYLTKLSTLTTKDRIQFNDVEDYYKAIKDDKTDLYNNLIRGENINTILNEINIYLYLKTEYVNATFEYKDTLLDLLKKIFLKYWTCINLYYSSINNFFTNKDVSIYIYPYKLIKEKTLINKIEQIHTESDNDLNPYKIYYPHAILIKIYNLHNKKLLEFLFYIDESNIIKEIFKLKSKYKNINFSLCYINPINYKPLEYTIKKYFESDRNKKLIDFELDKKMHQLAYRENQLAYREKLENTYEDIKKNFEDIKKNFESHSQIILNLLLPIISCIKSNVKELKNILLNILNSENEITSDNIIIQITSISSINTNDEKLIKIGFDEITKILKVIKETLESQFELILKLLGFNLQNLKSGRLKKPKIMNKLKQILIDGLKTINEQTPRNIIDYMVLNEHVNEHVNFLKLPELKFNIIFEAKEAALPIDGQPIEMD